MNLKSSLARVTLRERSMSSVAVIKDSSNNPSFYNGFENREQLIQWMRERPKGVANIYEVEGDSDIIVVIPTADFNGKYARECRNNIFNGLHIIFVESGEVPDPYFNYAHNCNVGVKKAMEYNPKWVVVSNDDMVKLPIGNTLIADRIRYRGRETNNVNGKNITIFDKENYNLLLVIF